MYKLYGKCVFLREYSTPVMQLSLTASFISPFKGDIFRYTKRDSTIMFFYSKKVNKFLNLFYNLCIFKNRIIFNIYKNLENDIKKYEYI